MRSRPELRDLRSLERRRLLTIFHPLDARERLPRELVLEGRRGLRRERHRLLGLGVMLYLPGLALVVLLLTHFGVSSALAFAVAGVLLAATYVYTLVAPFS